MPTHPRVHARLPVAGRLCAVLVAAALLALAPSAQAGHDETDWSQVQAEPVVEGSQFASDIEFAPDGSLWFSEVFTGDVLRRAPGGGVTLVHHVDSVSEMDERGLVGLALAPDHAESGAFYLYYTAPDPDEPDGGTNRIVRVESGAETLLAEVPGHKEHNGGRMAFTPEGHLLVGTGDNQLRDPAQDEDSLLGKMLRMTPDGEPVEGNLKGLVYSTGHRNVYGLAVDPDTGRIWQTENSGWRRDEVNIIEAHGNYGYPECEGQGLNGVDTPCPTDKGYIFPVMTFYEDRTAAPTGGAVWRGGFYWGSLREGSIHHTWQDADGVFRDEIVHTQGPAGTAVLDLAVSADGVLHFSTDGGIFRLRFPGDEPTETAVPRPEDPPRDETFGPTGDPAPGFGPAGVPGPGLLGIATLALLVAAFRRRM